MEPRLVVPPQTDLMSLCTQLLILQLRRFLLSLQHPPHHLEG